MQDGNLPFNVSEHWEKSAVSISTVTQKMKALLHQEGLMPNSHLDCQGELTGGMAAQDPILNVAVLLYAAFPGCTRDVAVVVAGAALSAVLMGKPAFTQLWEEAAKHEHTCYQEERTVFPIRVIEGVWNIWECVHMY